jgi:hypothetical protein
MESQKPTRHSQADVLQQFQLERLSIAEKSSKEFGLKMSQKIWSTVTSGIGGYYANRNAQFLENRNYANGRIDVQSMFQDRFQINGKQDYIRLVWQTLQIVNRIISGLVGRWMARGEKIQVQAIDTISVEDKIKEFQDLEYVVYNRKMLEQLQEQSGVQLIPQGEIPTDKDELEMWQSQFQRLPEEILTELACNEVLGANGWFDVLKEKMLHDSAEVGLVGTCVEMDDKGVIYIKYIKPENQIYSWTEYPDMRDTTWRGELPDIKISELRRQYGKEFNPENPNALTEEQLWEIARTAKEFKNYSNIQWTNVWYNAFMRPYDEWNVRCMKFELRSVDKEPYTVTKTKTTGTTYTQKGMPTTASGKTRPKPLDNQQVLDDSNINIYRGVYLPDNDTLLEWGLKKNMIRPQDPKEIGNAEFSYSYYMPQIYQMRNLAIPEKIKAAVNGMILALLKIQQVIARLVPSGWAIDETALQEVDYGLGDNNNQVDQARYYFQTGLMYYRGIGADGKRIEPPIKELVNNGFVGQMDGLIKCEDISLYLINRDNQVLMPFHPSLRKGALSVIEKSGVKVLLNTGVKEVKKGSIILNDDTSLDVNHVIWTAGVKPNAPKFSHQATLDTWGRIIVDDALSIPECPGVFVVGDIASSPTKDGKPLPMLAQVAVKQGLHTGGNIYRFIKGNKLLPFSYESNGSLVSLGQWQALADLKFIRFSGPVAWFIWRTVYLFKFLSHSKKIKIVLDWTVNIFYPRDITKA